MYILYFKVFIFLFTTKGESIVVAHQYQIREQKRSEEQENFLFDFSALSLKKDSKIKQISRKEAEQFIVEYEYLRSIPRQVSYCFGIFFNEFLGGVLIYSHDYTQNTGIWTEKYGFEDKLILLSRGACAWWTPKNTASYFISQTCKWLKQNTKYRIVTATVSPDAGEIGTIYQALNWHYIGLMKGNYHNGKEQKRLCVLINGVVRGARSLRKEFGCMKQDIVKEKYPEAIFYYTERKRRYFYFMDIKANNKKFYESIKHLIMLYPKRNEYEVVGIIYKITNNINKKLYIGQTYRAFRERIDDYKRYLCNDYLANSFKKYGFENFTFEIIDHAKTIGELNEKEIFYIEKYDSTNKTKGYNIEIGGRNHPISEETRQKLSQLHKGKKQSREWVEKRTSPKGSEEAKKHGRPKSPEQRKWLSENSPKFWLGKYRSEETKQKISETKKRQNKNKPFPNPEPKIVICQICYWESKDYTNCSGAITNHFNKHHPDFSGEKEKHYQIIDLQQN